MGLQAIVVHTLPGCLTMLPELMNTMLLHTALFLARCADREELQPAEQDNQTCSGVDEDDLPLHLVMSTLDLVQQYNIVAQGHGQNREQARSKTSV